MAKSWQIFWVDLKVFFSVGAVIDFPGKMGPDSVGLGKQIFKIWHVLIEYMRIIQLMSINTRNTIVA